MYALHCKNQSHGIINHQRIQWQPCISNVCFGKKKKYFLYVYKIMYSSEVHSPYFPHIHLSLCKKNLSSINLCCASIWNLLSGYDQNVFSHRKFRFWMQRKVDASFLFFFRHKLRNQTGSPKDYFNRMNPPTKIKNQTKFYSQTHFMDKTRWYTQCSQSFDIASIRQPIFVLFSFVHTRFIRSDKMNWLFCWLRSHGLPVLWYERKRKNHFQLAPLLLITDYLFGFCDKEIDSTDTNSIRLRLWLLFRTDHNTHIRHKYSMTFFDTKIWIMKVTKWFKIT